MPSIPLEPRDNGQREDTAPLSMEREWRHIKLIPPRYLSRIPRTLAALSKVLEITKIYEPRCLGPQRTASQLKEPSPTRVITKWRSEKRCGWSMKRGEAFIFNCSDCLIRPNESTHEKCVLCHINVTRRWCLIRVRHPSNTTCTSFSCAHYKKNIVRRSSTRHPESYKSIKLNADTTNHISCCVVHGVEGSSSSRRSWNSGNGKLMGTCLIKSLVWCTTFSSSHHPPSLLYINVANNCFRRRRRNFVIKGYTWLRSGWYYDEWPCSRQPTAADRFSDCL